MLRSLLISTGAHFGLGLFLLLLSVINPPNRARKPIIQARILAASPAPPDPGTLVAAATPVPEPPRPTPQSTPKPVEKTPAPTPRPVKTPTSEKEIVQENAEIIKATPKPTPTLQPTPAATPEPTPEATPEVAVTPTPVQPIETPYRTPIPTPTRTPRPVRVARGTPPQVPRGIIPNSPSPAAGAPSSTSATVPGVVITGALIAGESLSELSPNYVSIALFAIQQNFKPPWTKPGVTCVVQFRIMKDGEILIPRIIKSTGRSDLDASAIRALNDTARLPPLYEMDGGTAKPFRDVQVTFDFQKR